MSLRRNPLPPESPISREAIVEGYRALKVLKEAQLLDFIAEMAHDPMAAEQADAAIARMEARMSPNLLCTVLPAYTRVRFCIDGNTDEDRAQEGLLRDGAWGLFPDRTDSTTRRITAGGWEVFITPETEFHFFEVLERPEVAA